VVTVTTIMSKARPVSVYLDQNTHRRVRDGQCRDLADGIASVSQSGWKVTVLHRGGLDTTGVVGIRLEPDEPQPRALKAAIEAATKLECSRILIRPKSASQQKRTARNSIRHRARDYARNCYDPRAVEAGIIESNPAHGIRKPKDNVRKRRLSEAEYRILGGMLREAAKQEKYTTIVDIIRQLALTGAVSGAVIPLRRNGS
jgi:hypothetical protein